MNNVVENTNGIISKEKNTKMIKDTRKEKIEERCLFTIIFCGPVFNYLVFLIAYFRLLVRNIFNFLCLLILGPLYFVVPFLRSFSLEREIEKEREIDIERGREKEKKRKKER